MNKFKGRISKMGERKVICVPEVVKEYFDVGETVEVKGEKK
jgi:hypothetical protein